MGEVILRLGFAVPAVNVNPQTVVICTQAIHDACQSDCITHETHVQYTVAGPSLIAEARNRAIAALSKKKCSVIASVDVDCIVPPGLPAATLKIVRTGVALVHFVRDIEQWRGWDDLERYFSLPVRRYGLGGYVAMTTNDWLLVGGWDERCIGWGGEDYVMFKRLLKLKFRVVRCQRFPLLHIRHPRRLSRKYHYRNLKLAQQPQPNFLRRYIDEEAY